MNRFFAWSVPVVALGLVLSGCSSDKAESAESSASSASATTTSARCRRAEPSGDKAATDYKALRDGQIDELVGTRQGIHRRGASR